MQILPQEDRKPLATLEKLPPTRRARALALLTFFEFARATDLNELIENAQYEGAALWPRSAVERSLDDCCRAGLARVWCEDGAILAELRVSGDQVLDLLNDAEATAK